MPCPGLFHVKVQHNLVIKYFWTIAYKRSYRKNSMIIFRKMSNVSCSSKFRKYKFKEMLRES